MPEKRLWLISSRKVKLILSFTFRSVLICLFWFTHPLQVLVDFPHTTAELKLDYLLDLFPEIQPRFFSIASSLQV